MGTKLWTMVDTSQLLGKNFPLVPQIIDSSLSMTCSKVSLHILLSKSKNLGTLWVARQKLYGNDVCLLVKRHQAVHQ